MIELFIVHIVCVFHGIHVDDVVVLQLLVMCELILSKYAVRPWVKYSPQTKWYKNSIEDEQMMIICCLDRNIIQWNEFRPLSSFKRVCYMFQPMLVGVCSFFVSIRHIRLKHICTSFFFYVFLLFFRSLSSYVALWEIRSIINETKRLDSELWYSTKWKPNIWNVQYSMV